MKHLLLWLLLVPVIASSQVDSNMIMLANFDLPNLPSRFGSEYSDCWGFRHSNGTEIAILAGIEDIFFVNVTIPASPTLITTYHVTNQPSGTTNQSLWRDFKTYGNYAYAASDEGTAGLLIFDLTNAPTSITMVNQVTSWWNRTHNIYIDEENGRLYAAGSNSTSTGLIILDLNNTPTNPALVGAVPLNGIGGGYVHDVHVRDNIAYCSHGSLGKIQMYDFSNYPTITIVGTIENYPEVGYNHSSWLNESGNLLAMCDETHGSDVKIVDVSDPDNISGDDFHTFYSELLGPNVPDAPIAHNPFILGNLVYVAYYHEGVQVYDITNPTDINRLAYYDTYPENTDYVGYKGCWGVYPFLPSGNIIASDQNHGLYVMQIENSPLDIKFIEFEASRQSAGVYLHWTIADAFGGSRFEVQRSTDGGNQFTTIGQVAFNPGTSRFEFWDSAISDYRKYYYRIQFIEDDGKRISSPLRFIRTIAKENPVGVVNPIQQELILDFANDLTNLELSLFDSGGKLVWKQKMAQSQGRETFSLPAIPSGQYLLTMQWPDGTQNVMVQKID